MPAIHNFINDRNKYKVDHTYQRPVDTKGNHFTPEHIENVIKQYHVNAN